MHKEILTQGQLTLLPLIKNFPMIFIWLAVLLWPCDTDTVVR